MSKVGTYGEKTPRPSSLNLARMTGAEYTNFAPIVRQLLALGYERARAQTAPVELLRSRLDIAREILEADPDAAATMARREAKETAQAQEITGRAKQARQLAIEAAGGDASKVPPLFLFVAKEKEGRGAAERERATSPPAMDKGVPLTFSELNALATLDASREVARNPSTVGALARLEARGLVRAGRLTPEGRAFLDDRRTQAAATEREELAALASLELGRVCPVPGESQRALSGLAQQKQAKRTRYQGRPCYTITPEGHRRLIRARHDQEIRPMARHPATSTHLPLDIPIGAKDPRQNALFNEDMSIATAAARPASKGSGFGLEGGGSPHAAALEKARELGQALATRSGGKVYTDAELTKAADLALKGEGIPSVMRSSWREAFLIAFRSKEKSVKVATQAEGYGYKHGHTPRGSGPDPIVAGLRGFRDLIKAAGDKKNRGRLTLEVIREMNPKDPHGIGSASSHVPDNLMMTPIDQAIGGLKEAARELEDKKRKETMPPTIRSNKRPRLRPDTAAQAEARAARAEARQEKKTRAIDLEVEKAGMRGLRALIALAPKRPTERAFDLLDVVRKKDWRAANAAAAALSGKKAYTLPIGEALEDLKKITADYQARMKRSDAADKKSDAKAAKAPKESAEARKARKDHEADARRNAKEAAKQATKARAAEKKAERERLKAEKNQAKAESKKTSAREKQIAKEKAKLERKQAAKDAAIAKAAEKAAKAAAHRAAVAEKHAAQEAEEDRRRAALPSFSAEALIHASDTDARELLQLAGKNQRRHFLRELGEQLKTCRREIAKMKTARKQRLKVIRERCREAGKQIRARMRKLREEFIKQFAALKNEDVDRRKVCGTEIADALHEVGGILSAEQQRLSRIQSLRGMVHGMKAPPTPAQLAAAKRRHEVQSEANEAVSRELEATIPGAERWWAAKGQNLAEFKASRVPKGSSRAEFVVNAIAQRPDILENFFEAEAAKALAAKEKEEKELSKLYKRKQVQREQRGSRTFERTRTGYGRRPSALAGRRGPSFSSTPF